ncbi:MAG TPA: BON domain-containing protein [Gemmatimonadaceae bacterium]|jgi:hypothetical protein
MSPRFRYRDEESSSTATIIGVLAGALAGFAAGMYVAQRVGGVSGLRSKFGRRRDVVDEEQTLRDQYDAQRDTGDFDDFEEDEIEGEGYDEGLEERVLEAFRNDPILAERAIDIGSISDAAIELAGWVEDEDEAHHAVTIARGVPGVDTVVNRIAIGDEERRFEAAARRREAGDPALNESHWEGGQVGTGRRRQGTSADIDRHSTPKVPLEDRWLGADAAMRDAAEDVEGLAERRTRSKKAVRGDRAGGAAVSPTGVPKADHVANPTGDADDEVEGDRM